MTRLPSLTEVQAEQCRRSLTRFIKDAWPVIEPHTTLLWNWHIDLICEYLAAVSQGEITRVIFNLPPRYMKSRTIGVCWPAWEWISYPGLKYLFSGYAVDKARDDRRDCRRLIRSEWYQQRWGDRYQILPDQDVVTHYVNTEGGEMQARGTGGGATGKGGNRIVIDDPHKTQKVESEVEREGALKDFDTNLSTRLNDKRRDAIVVVMQRQHEKDLTGHLLAKGDERWVHVKIPGEAPAHTIVRFPSGREVERQEGEPLWPEREDEDILARQKVDMGSWAYAAQYDQEPAPAGGGIVKDEWWQFYEQTPHIEAFHEIVQSWDMAFKDTKASSYVVGQVWGRIGADKFLLDQVRRKMDLPTTIRAVLQLSRDHPRAVTKWIEDKANGPAVMQTLRGKLSGMIPVDPEGDKTARLHAVSPQIESGNVYLPHPSIKPWVKDFMVEVARFPNSEYSDQVDAMSQALNKLQRRVSTFGIEDGSFMAESAITADGSPWG